MAFAFTFQTEEPELVHTLARLFAWFVKEFPRFDVESCLAYGRYFCVKINAGVFF